MQAIITVLLLPLMILNFLGVIVGAVWLMILGEWGALGIALIAICFGAIACGFALIPGLLISAPALLMYEKGGLLRLVSFPLMFAGLTWVFAVMCVWGLGSFIYFLKRADAPSLIPMLLVAFSVATGPWAYMAQKESQGGDSTSAFSVLFLELASAVLLVMLGFGGSRLSTAGTAFLVIMAIALVINVGVAIAVSARAGSRRDIY